MSINTVFFTGTIPKKGRAPFGGGEVGNMRTIRMFESFGYKVITVRRLRSGEKESRLMKRFYYPFRTLKNVVQWLFVLLFACRKNSVAHISGFYGNTIYVETLQVFITKLLGYKLVYELRGGGATDFYEKGSAIYKRQFNYIINKADYLLSQGKENEPLLNKLCNTLVFYYPNCVQEGFYPEILPIKPTDRINLLFYGRIEPEKNPFLIIETTALLQSKFDNINLKMIGNGQDDLKAQLKREMERKLKKGSYTLFSGCEHDELRKHLYDQHFYLFPSVQPREGQSNAVTEAMSYGIIPIASPQGFNRSTIGDDNLIVETLAAEAYAERIASIVSNGKIKQYSEFVRRRFLDNFTEDVVFENTRKEYEIIFNSWYEKKSKRR